MKNNFNIIIQTFFLAFTLISVSTLIINYRRFYSTNVNMDYFFWITVVAALIGLLLIKRMNSKNENK